MRSKGRETDRRVTVGITGVRGGGWVPSLIDGPTIVGELVEGVVDAAGLGQELGLGGGQGVQIAEEHCAPEAVQA